MGRAGAGACGGGAEAGQRSELRARPLVVDLRNEKQAS